MKNLMLITIIIIFGLCQLAYSEECDFGYLMQEGRLFASLSKEKTKDELQNENAWEKLQEILPNLRRASFSDAHHFGALLGWSESPVNIESLSRGQAVQHLQAAENEARQAAIKDNASIITQISETDPITLYTTKTYSVGNEGWKDVSVDIIATPRCVASIKVFSPDRSNLDWSEISKELESIRHLLLAKYGPINFRTSPQRISKAGIYGVLIFIFTSALIAVIFYMTYVKLFILNLGRLLRLYLLFVIVANALLIILTIFFNEAFGMKVVVMPYEVIISSVLLILISLWGYMTQTKRASLIAISFIIGSLITHVISTLIGWSKTGWSGIIIGFILVGYVLTKSSIRIQSNAN